MDKKEAKKLLNNKEWLTEKINSKKSQTDIAKELGISTSAVYRKMAKFGIEALDLSTIRRSHIDEDKLRLIEDRDWLYNEYMVNRSSLIEIANKIGSSKEFIKDQLKRFNIPLISHIEQVTKHIPEDVQQKLSDVEWLTENYVNQRKSLMQLERELGVTRHTIKARMQKLGIKIKTSKEQLHTGIPPESLDKLNDKEWLIEQNHNLKLPATAIAKKLGISERTVLRRMHDVGIVPVTKPISNMEYSIRSIVDITKSECVFNKRDIIPPYELDIFLPDHNIAIEFCGLYWHSEFRKDNDYHKIKHNLCKNKGIRLLTIFEDEFVSKEKIIIDKINYILKQSNNKVYARKTCIVEVDNITKVKFFDDNHIQGDGPSSINFGLQHNGELVACIGFIKNNDGSYILNRYATSCNVVGGFSKLLSYFEKIYNKPKIITFADLRWSEGDLYYNSGFTMDKELKPDYYWCKNQIRYHKFNFRHTTGLKTLENYDPKLTEVQNMHNHGYYRIYDCGKLRFIKN